MKILQIGISEDVVASLEEKSHVVFTDEVKDPDDLLQLIEFYLCDGVVVNFPAAPWAIIAARKVRLRKIITPIIGTAPFFDVSTWSEERAHFLENGGSDLLPDPVNSRELVASLSACLLRNHVIAQDIVEFKGDESSVVINLVAMRVTVNGTLIKLTAMEMKVLAFLVQNVGRVCSDKSVRSSLYNNIVDEPEGNVPQVLISRIRAKLSAEHPEAGQLIETIRGAGYSIKDPLIAIPVAELA